MDRFSTVMGILRERSQAAKSMRFEGEVTEDVVDKLPDEGEADAAAAAAAAAAKSPAVSPSVRRVNAVKAAAAAAASEDGVLVVDVPAGPLGMRLMPRNEDDETGAVVLEFKGVPVPGGGVVVGGGGGGSNNQLAMSPVQAAGVAEGMELFAIDECVVTALHFAHIMAIVQETLEEPRTLRFRVPASALLSRSLTPPPSDEERRAAMLTALLSPPGSPGNSPGSSGRNSPLGFFPDPSEMPVFASLETGAAALGTAAEQELVTSIGAEAVALRRAAELKAERSRRRQREKEEEGWSVWVLGIMERVQARGLGSARLGPVERRRNVRAVLSKNVLVFYALEKPPRGWVAPVPPVVDPAAAAAAAATAAAAESADSKTAATASHRVSSEDNKVLLRLDPLVVINRHTSVSGDAGDPFFTITTGEIATPAAPLNMGELKRLCTTCVACIHASGRARVRALF
jgi:hypothetical protein